MPRWVFDLLRQRIDALGIANLPLIIEPQTAGSTHRVLSLGRIEARPTVKLTPRLRAEGLDWRQDLTRLLAKAVAYVTAPDDGTPISGDAGKKRRTATAFARRPWLSPASTGTKRTSVS